MKLVTGVLSCVAAMLGTSIVSADGDAPDADFVPVSAISTYDLWHALDPQLKAGGNFSGAYWEIDQESARHAGKQRVCGLLLLGSPDIASRPVGIEVRDGSCGYRLDIVASRVGGLQRFSMRNAAGRSEVFEVTESGEVRLRGKRLGQIEFP